MVHVIGMDEAGYGPNLGPLVISGSVWRLPDRLCPEALYDALVAAVTPCPSAGDPRVAIADSKALYVSGGGWRLLERGLWAALGQLGHRPWNSRGLWQILAPTALEEPTGLDGPGGLQRPLPRDAGQADCDGAADSLRQAMATAGIRLEAFESRAVFPRQFNALLGRYESKGAALSHQTLTLLADLVDPLDAGPIIVCCDKYGGRDRYAPLLAEHFPGGWIEVRGESRQRSVYRFGPTERRIEIRFEARAETYLPVALASMASKYLRELAMEAMNAFWAREVPGLAPTAGYPEDARRFRAAIAEAQRRLGIDNQTLWRNK